MVDSYLLNPISDLLRLVDSEIYVDFHSLRSPFYLHPILNLEESINIDQLAQPCICLTRQQASYDLLNVLHTEFIVRGVRVNLVSLTNVVSPSVFDADAESGCQ